LVCSRSGSARTRFGVFVLRDFDFGIVDGLLAPSPIASSNGPPFGVAGE
jgi:hypothetical protein